MSSSNAKWPFSLSHNQLQAGGWARQQNGKQMYLEYNNFPLTKDRLLIVDEMPIATGKFPAVYLDVH